MITKLSTYITDNTVPYRNLAIEEYLTLHTEPDECILFLWQNRRTVVIGKNQNCWKECKVNCLEEDGGYLVRRLSGGGAVFHDLGNLNFTFCVRKENYDVDRQLEVILQAARLLGLDARKTGRNDVTIEGRKFSGNAFYESGDFCYHHGTLLLDVNKEDMSRYLNVSREKLQSKGVDSVRSRVANLIEFNPQITVPLMQEKLVQAFGMVYGLETQVLSKDRIDWEDVHEKEQKFGSWEWKYGRRIPFQYSASRRFGWGDVELQFQVDGGIIKSVNVFSDGMNPKLVGALPAAWEGCRYEEQALIAALEQTVEALQKDSEAAEHAEAGTRILGSRETEQQMKQDIGELLRECL